MDAEIHLVIGGDEFNDEAIEAWPTKELAEKRVAELMAIVSEFQQALKIAGIHKYKAPREWLEKYRAAADRVDLQPYSYYELTSVPMKGST